MDGARAVRGGYRRLARKANPQEARSTVERSVRLLRLTHGRPGSAADSGPDRPGDDGTRYGSGGRLLLDGVTAGGQGQGENRKSSGGQGARHGQTPEW